MGPIRRSLVQAASLQRAVGEDLIASPGRLYSLSLLSGALALVVTLAGCGPRDSGSACLDGGSTCAASHAPPGMRGERRGYRLHRYHWLRRPNRESGVPDVGIQADWLPFRERR